MKKTAFALLLLVTPLMAKAGVNRWTPFGRGDDTVLDLLLTPQGLYSITSDGRLFRSGDSGVTWEYLASVGGLMAADPLNPRVMTAVTQPGDVYRSVDAGRSWGHLRWPVDQETYTPGIASIKTAAGTIYVGGLSLYVSRDNGESWSSSNPVEGAVSAMAVDPSKPRTVWFASTAGLWKTVDAGKTFSLVLGGEGFTAVAVSPSRPATLYAGGSGRSWSSQDGGATWRPGGDPGVADLTALAVDPAMPAKVYAAGLGGVAASQDGGATWTVLGSRPAAFSLIAARKGLLFAGTDGDGLQLSRNGGRSWSRQDQVGMGYPQAAFIGRDRGGALYLYHYFTAGPGLLRSADDGRTWTPVNDIPADQIALYGVAVDRRRSGVLWAVGPDGTFRIGKDGVMRRLPVSPQLEMDHVATVG
ncbi:MAG TPA: hypothetical protein VH394_27990, partial [Thermoanaerobaculia bacterium]|nr:hypothetical protein [Thermoanaerobaculia bacterium]